MGSKEKNVQKPHCGRLLAQKEHGGRGTHPQGGAWQQANLIIDKYVRERWGEPGEAAA